MWVNSHLEGHIDRQYNFIFKKEKIRLKEIDLKKKKKNSKLQENAEKKPSYIS